jgi:hypothetical protein
MYSNEKKMHLFFWPQVLMRKDKYHIVTYQFQTSRYFNTTPLHYSSFYIEMEKKIRSIWWWRIVNKLNHDTLWFVRGNNKLNKKWIAVDVFFYFIHCQFVDWLSPFIFYIIIIKFYGTILKNGSKTRDFEI